MHLVLFHLQDCNKISMYLELQLCILLFVYSRHKNLLRFKQRLITNTNYSYQTCQFFIISYDFA